MKVHHSIKGTFHFRHAEHPWEKATGAALTMGLSVLAGVILGNIEWGLLATVGGFASLYVTNDEMFIQRFLKQVVVALGLAISIALGTLAATNIWAMAFTIGIVSMAATLAARAFQIPPPSGYFFILVCALGTGLPLNPAEAPVRFGFACLGGVIALIISTIGWYLYPRTLKENPNPVLGPIRVAMGRITDKQFDVIPATIRIGIATFVATIIAYLLGNPRPYWVPLTVASVLQGATVIATVQRTLQRALGTGIGVCLGGTILALHPNAWWLIVSLVALQWIVEMLIVRNYGLAVIFITPIPLLLAEAGFPALHPTYLVDARLWDTVLGCAVGVIAVALSWFRRRAA